MPKTGKLIYEGSNSCESFEWDDIGLISPHKFKSDCWLGLVRGFGWRRQDGHKYFTASNLRTLLSSILPDTECNFKIHNWGKGFAIQNFHHDSCTGNEWYYCKPISEINYRRNTQ